MDVASYFIRNKTTSWMLSAILLIGGVLAYMGLGRLEDPEFTLKQALIITQYPGASPEQVEEEVSYPLENAIQQLPSVDFITSISTAGTSQIMVEMKNTYRAKELKQIWDELRRKVNDLKPQLPPGVGTPMVNDDFGDVYGLFFAVTGEGYQDEELRDYVDFLRRELVIIEGVGKVSVGGIQHEQVVVEFSRSRLATLGIAPLQIANLLQTQNVVSNAGSSLVGPDRVRIHPTGEFQAVEELEQLIISNPAAKELIYLGDVAKVYKAVQETPSHLMKFNGQNALTLGVSFSSGVNVVDVAGEVLKKLEALEYARPVGIDVNTVYNQAAEVDVSVSGFVQNLAESVVIVILVLLVFMGLKSGLLIGLILLLTVLGTFIFMQQMNIELQRVSLGALIIALGMLVDNAIVITEGILIGIQRRLTITQAAVNVVKQTKWPLLGATAIGIIAFAPIGLSSDATGEFAGSLFTVLLVSLLLSWVTALTLTPFFASLFFKREEAKAAEAAPELYQGVVFDVYRGILTFVLRYRVLSYVVMLGLLVGSVVAFGKVKQVFFPASTTPMFLVDLWQPAGTDVRETERGALELSNYLQQQEGVQAVTVTSGRGADRFMLTYQPERFYPSYSQLIVRVDNLELLTKRMHDVVRFVKEQQPNLQQKLKRLEIGPATTAKIEARFSGAEPVVLRQLAEQAKAILKSDPASTNVRDDWSNRVKVIRPQFNEAVARRVGISKQDIDDVLLSHLNGKTVGVYREGTRLLPIITRSPHHDREDIDTLQDVQVYSSKLNRYIPLSQVVSRFDVEWEDAQIMRRDRKRTLTVMADNNVLGDETAAALLARVRPAIEAIALPPGYALEWGGELEAQTKAQKALFSSLPLGYLVMLVITVLLFNSLRDALVIWACVPMAIIGVSLGLLSVGVPFGFMALLGFLSLSGLLVKNGIVLIDQLNLEKSQGLAPYDAVVQSAISRVRPVAMSAITTILGMLPLAFDDFFASKAVVIMFGLGFGTILTLLFLPLMYCTMYRIKTPARAKAS